MQNAAHYVAAVVTDSSCVGNEDGNYEIAICEADPQPVREDPYTGAEVVEYVMSDREVALIDTGISLDDDIPEGGGFARPLDRLLRQAGWSIDYSEEPEVASDATYYHVTPDDPDLVNAPEIAAAHIREMVAALNAHDDAHQAHDADQCGCNPFEDVAYGFPQFDGPKTDKRFAEHEYAFVLADGTEITADAGARYRWQAARYILTGEFLRTGIPDDRSLIWHMDPDGKVTSRDTGTWQPVQVFYTHQIKGSTDGQSWDAQEGTGLEAEATASTATEYARDVLERWLDDATRDGAGTRRGDGLHYRVSVWPGRAAAGGRLPGEPAATATWHPTREFTLWVVTGTQPGIDGTELNAPDSPVAYSDLDEETHAWLGEQGADGDSPDVRVLVTAAGAGVDAALFGLIASRTIALPV